MTIQINPTLQRNIERASDLGLPFALHTRNSTAGKIEFILIRCFNQSGSRIDFGTFLQNHDYYLIPQDFLDSEIPYSFQDSSYTPLEIIFRSTETYLDEPFDSLLEHKNQSCGPKGEPPCEACIRRVHCLVLLGNYFNAMPTYCALIKGCLDAQMSKWPDSRPQSCAPTSRPQSCTPTSRPQSCTPTPRPPVSIPTRSSKKSFDLPHQ